MPPAIIGGVIAGVGALGGAAISAGATKSAANSAANSAAANNALQKQIYDTNTQNLSPYMKTGTTALNQLSASQQPGFDWNAQIANDPAAQFQMQQGVNAITNNRAASGMLNSGGTLKALDRYGQGVASDSINNWWNRNSQLANFGLSGANALAGVGTNMANAVGQNNNNAAAASGNAALAGASQINGLIGQGINGYATYAGYNSLNPTLNYGGGAGTFGGVGPSDFSNTPNFGVSGLSF